MVEVKQIVCGELNENCYIVKKDNDAIIIDPGDNYEKIVDYITLKKLNVHAVLLTHGHYDHISSCKRLQNLGYKIYVHELDAEKCKDNELNLSLSFSHSEIETFNPDILLKGNETLLFNDIKVITMHTPGHSEGGCCYIIDKYIFSGDTLFKNGIGRIDFYDGSLNKIIQSIKKISEFVSNGYILCDGHEFN